MALPNVGGTSAVPANATSAVPANATSAVPQTGTPAAGKLYGLFSCCSLKVFKDTLGP